jgi:hypothetical protein
MYLLPYVRATGAGGSAAPAVQQIWLFLERNGTHLLSVEGVAEGDVAAGTAAALEFAAVNELSVVGAGATLVADVVLLEIDPTDKDLASFYSWKEVAPGTTPPCELWRPFLWIRDDELGVNKQLEEIRLGPGAGHTAAALLTAVEQQQQTLS